MNVLKLLYNTLMNPTTADKIAGFFNTDKPLFIKKGEVLLEPGIEPSGVFYIKKGAVKMTAISAGGEEVVINTYKSGAFFPVGWVLNDTPNNYYYQTAEDTEIQKTTKQQMLQFLEREPTVVFDLMKRIYRGLEGYFVRMEYLMAGNASSRLITEIIILAKRFGEKEKDGVSLKKVTETELAAQTGMTRETVSREFKKLIQKDLISFHQNKLLIKDLSLLEKELV